MKRAKDLRTARCLNCRTPARIWRGHVHRHQDDAPGKLETAPKIAAGFCSEICADVLRPLTITCCRSCHGFWKPEYGLRGPMLEAINVDGVTYG